MTSSHICAAGGFLFLGPRLLVLRRSEASKFLPRFYDVPGGKLEGDETPEQGLIREVREETNLIVRPIHEFNQVSYVTDTDVEITETHFLIELLSPISHLRLSDEHDEFAFITRDGIDSIKMSDEMRSWCKKAFDEQFVAEKE